MNDHKSKGPLDSIAALSALLIALISGVSYVAAYLYQVGMSARFCIPMEFANVSTTDLITVAVVALIVAWVVTALLALVPKDKIATMSTEDLVLFGVLPVILAALVVSFMVPAGLTVHVIVIALFIGWLLFLFLRNKTQDAYQGTALQWVRDRYGTGPLVLTFVLVASLPVAALAGYEKPLYTSRYLFVLPNYNEMVIARSGDQIITANFDTRTSTVGHVLHVYKFGESGFPSLNYRTARVITPSCQ